MTYEDPAMQMTHDLVLAKMAEYERVAEEFGFEPYGTPEEEAASYNRHRLQLLTRLNDQAAAMRAAINRGRRDNRVALVAAGCLLACAALWVLALHYWWPLS